MIIQLLCKYNINQVAYNQANQIPLPPTKAEQTAIATALNDADALINQLEQLLTKKRNIKTGAMQELLKPKEGWEVKKLRRNCLRLRQVKSFPKSMAK